MTQINSPGRIARIIKAALEHQDALWRRLPSTRLKEAKGRTARLVVDDPFGEESSIMYFKVIDGRLVIEELEPETVRNEIIFFGKPEVGYTGVDAFIDCFRDGNAARTAYASGYVAITGDLATYDSEELLQLLEEWVDQVARFMGLRKK